ncbi:fused MFS/spermidine synthase [Opitutus sp. GAS368]|uniref:spermidine synthase n=1 Tax=Opitutus sp. GAS368 TaxID=1882749 RepID=UPI0008792B6D|nr:fused MFS/spermidine synthase [Opitutus sp. GAS368]SDR65208.1 spermidine synthase [Opitutus sp. GAS368]
MDSAPPANADPREHPRFLPVLLALSAGSGCAALIYEVVWFQQLQLVIGSSALSLALLLGTFMGGLCLGNLALPRLVSAARHPLRVYALIELGLGLLAILLLFVLPALGRDFPGWLGAGPADGGWRAGLGAMCLLPPTMLMGATLPAIARWLGTTPRDLSQLGLVYAANTVGAVAGSLLAGFYLLRVYDTVVATLVAAALNAVIAAGALGLARGAKAGQAAAPGAPSAATLGAPAVLVTIALSGFCALGAEVVWTRLLSLLLGATVYAFSIILAAFLTGLSLGGVGGALMARRTTRPGFALGCCQLLQILAIGWASDMLARTLVFRPVDYAAEAAAGIRFWSELIRCGVAILPAACLWGASFPLALAAAGGTGRDPARVAGRIGAANTIGAVLGAAVASPWLLPLLGTARTEWLLIALSTLGAFLVLRPRRAADWIIFAGAAALGGLVGATTPGVPWQLVSYGAYATAGDQTARVLYLGEGATATVAVTQSAGGTKYFHVSGKTEASSHPRDMRMQRMLGDLPALVHPAPRSVLVVGCGAGVTAGSFVPHPSVTRLVICEIEPLIPRFVAPLFSEENHAVLTDPRVEIVHDDARHFLATTSEKFDVITSDPIHPWVKGAAVLYTAEYFALCRAHLRPGGVAAQWVPLYNSNRAAVQSELATFGTAFPAATVWGNEGEDGGGYDVVVLGTEAPPVLDDGALQRRLDRPDHAGVKASLAGVGLGSARALLGIYAGRLADLHAWLAGAEINRDRNLRLQYLAGAARNSREGRAAYAEMLALRHPPAAPAR